MVLDLLKGAARASQEVFQVGFITALGLCKEAELSSIGNFYKEVLCPVLRSLTSICAFVYAERSDQHSCESTVRARYSWEHFMTSRNPRRLEKSSKCRRQKSNSEGVC